MDQDFYATICTLTSVAGGILGYVIGALLWLRRLWQRKADDPDVDALLLLLLWALTMLAPSVLSEAAPNYSRINPSKPSLCLPVL